MFSFLIRLRNAFLVRWWRVTVRPALRSLGVELGDRVVFYGWPDVRMALGSRILVDDSVVLCSDHRFTDLGVAKPMVLRTLGPRAQIVIGRDTGMSGTVICSATSVTIGRECLMGADVHITDTDFHPIAPQGRRHEARPERISSRPVLIGDNVFLGAGVRVLKGVTIGNDAVIGAGAIVTGDVPAGAIVVGVPGRVVGSVYDDAIAH